MLAWRLCRAKYAETAFSGRGASENGGRWNAIGTPMVYASGSAALAILEALAHFDRDNAPPGYVFFRIDLPDDLVEELDARHLPRGWDALEPPDALKRIGSDWALSQRSLALSVPSVVVPMERNILLNPLHPAFAKLTIAPPQPFRFDPRL